MWEHQSSFNPNMPIRALSYFARLYQNYINENRVNVYSSMSKNKSEVVALFLTEYDEQAQRELDREEAREDGLTEGRTEGKCLHLIRIAKIKAEKGIPAKDTAEMLEEPVELIGKLYEMIREHPDWSEEMIYEKGKDKIME